MLGGAAIVGGKAYALSSDGLLACIDLANNNPVWYKQLGGHNNEATPALGNGKVYVGTSDGHFYVIDAANGSGAPLMDTAVGAPFFTSPLLTPDGVYLGNSNGTFYAFDLNGHTKWIFAARLRILHSAAAMGSSLVFTDGDQMMYRLTDNGSSFTVHFANHTPGSTGQGYVKDFVSPVSIWRDTILVSHGWQEYGTLDYRDHGVTCYDLLTGLFLKKLDCAKSVSKTGVSVDTGSGYYYMGMENYGLVAQRAGYQGNTINAYWTTWPTDGGTTPLPTDLGAVSSAPAVTGNCVIFGSEDMKGLHFYNKTSASPQHGTSFGLSFSFSKPVTAPVAISDGRVVVGCEDGCLYGFWNGSAVNAPKPVTGGLSVSGKGILAPAPLLSLLESSPNPFNSTVFIKYQLSRESRVDLRIYNSKGQQVAILTDSRMKPGCHLMTWNAKSSGRLSATGIYYAHIRAGDCSKKLPIIIMK